MSALAEKLLRSGIVDKHTAALLERYGIIESGSTEKVPEGNPLAHATKTQLTKLAEELTFEVEKDQALRETMLDLEKIRWPVTVDIWNDGTVIIAHAVTAVIDRMGRFYFRSQDVQEIWFIPGYRLRDIRTKAYKTILEVSPLYIGETLVCYQVSTQDEQ